MAPLLHLPLRSQAQFPLPPLVFRPLGTVGQLPPRPLETVGQMHARHSQQRPVLLPKSGPVAFHPHLRPLDLAEPGLVELLHHHHLLDPADHLIQRRSSHMGSGPCTRLPVEERTGISIG